MFTLFSMANSFINFFNMIKESIRLFWDLAKLFFNLLYGIGKLSKLKKSPISIFGGTFLKKTDNYLEEAKRLAHMLSEAGIPILTGGGPGIMEAASCGSFDPSLKKNIIKSKIIKNIGISLRGLNKKNFNRCVENTIETSNFYSRKWLLINYSIGFAVFPGGFGTLDELSNLLTLIQTKQRSKVPIILIGKDYWDPFISWIKIHMLQNGFITDEDFSSFRVTDDVDEAFNFLNAYCGKRAFKLFDK